MGEPGSQALQLNQIVVEVPRAQAGTAEAALQGLGALSVTLRDAGDEPLLEPLPGEQPLWGRVRVEALIPASVPSEAVGTALGDTLGSPCPWAVFPVPERDWVRETQAAFPARRFGRRLWVCPSWEEAPREATVLRLDPGLAFGTGAHPTTALCLEWLDAHPPRGQQVVDYGCGSGILGIAAALLGASTVWATDIDAQALEATRSNAAHNDLEPHRLQVVCPEALDGTSVSLVLANILQGPLLALQPTLTALVAPGGTLVLSGLLRDQAEAVRMRYTPAFRFVAERTLDDWVLLEARRS